MLLSWWRRRWRPDLIHVQGYANTLLFAIEWAHSRGVPVVYEEHQTPTDQFDWWKDFPRTINKAAVVVAVSEESARALRDVCGVVRPIVARSPLLPDPLATERDLAPQSLCAAGSVRMTTVARLSVTKGLDHLLDAIVQVRKRHPAAEFSVHGDGPLKDELFTHARRLGLDPTTIFVGPFTSRDQLARIMAGTDIFVMSSVLEGQPLALVEAMAYGCPIVTTAVGGIPELIQDGVNGLLCPAGNAERLARHVCTLIEDASLRRRLGQAARRSYEASSFQPSAVCSHLASVYETALRSVNRDA
jgi:glycosyltransferase involved in cell wall biosynthesis